jgi:mono/diheme cytochrome c family protein
MRETIGWLTLGAALLALPGCDVGFPAGRTPHREFNYIDMGDQPKLKPQRGDLFGARPTGMAEPPQGAVALGEVPYPYAQGEADKAGALLVNPLTATPEVLAHGQFMYENVCIACHGPKAAGDGHVTALFPKPPSLMTQKVRDWPDGQLFHRPKRGQNSMPSHARQVDDADIWSILHYLRKLQAELPVAPPPPAPAPAAAPAPTQGGQS